MNSLNNNTAFHKNSSAKDIRSQQNYYNEITTPIFFGPKKPRNIFCDIWLFSKKFKNEGCALYVHVEKSDFGVAIKNPSKALFLLYLTFRN